MNAYSRTTLSMLAVVAFAATLPWGASSSAQQRPGFAVDPRTQRAIGARLLPADELKKQLDAGAKILIIEVREPGKFGETLPGAINVPLDQVEGYLASIPRDTQLVFT